MPLAAWLPLQKAAAGFREECTSLEQLVQELFGDIDRLGAELEAKAEELDVGRRRLAERGRQLADQRKETARLSHQLEQQETQLTEALSELRALKTELAGHRDAPGTAAADLAEPFRQRVAELEVERAVLLERLRSAAEMPRDGAGGESAAVLSAQTIASLAEHFADLKQHLQSSSSTLAEAVEQAAQRAIASLPPPVVPEFVMPSGATGENGPELALLKQERVELEAELEIVRGRYAQLQEAAARQKKELDEQRTEVNGGLKELRRMVEEQALLLVHEGSPRSAAELTQLLNEDTRPARAASSPPRQEAAPAPAADPVVSSVMAQFAKLQRDVAQRRKKK